MRLRRIFLIPDFRFPIFGSATPLLAKGQRRLSSSNRQSAIKNGQCVARLMCLYYYETPIDKEMRDR